MSDLLDALPHIVWTALTNGEVNYFNQRWYSFTGLTPEQSVGEAWQHALHLDDLEQVLNRWSSAVRTKNAYEIEVRLRRSDGVYVWHLVRSNPIGAEGESWLGTCTDIEVQRQTKNMLELVMDNIPQSIFWKDRDSKFLGSNTRFARQAGVNEPVDLIGKCDFDMVWTREQSEFFRACDRIVMESDTPEYHIIEPQLRPDRKQAWLDTSKIPLHDAVGNVIGVLGMYEDITEQVKLLQQRSDFTASLAHDLKVPVIGALRALDIILNETLGPITPQLAEFVSQIKEGHEELLALIQNLVLVLQMEADSDNLKFASFDLEELILNCVNEIELATNKKTIQIQTHTESTIIVADRLAIKRALINLLNTAVGFSQTKVPLNVLLTTKSDQVDIEVKIFGNPIEETDLKLLFQRIWQGTRFGAGVGLSLYMCRQLVEAHGGLVSCRRHNEGTIFSITLPLETVPTKAYVDPRSALSRLGLFEHISAAATKYTKYGAD